MTKKEEYNQLRVTLLRLTGRLEEKKKEQEENLKYLKSIGINSKEDLQKKILELEVSLEETLQKMREQESNLQKALDDQS